MKITLCGSIAFYDHMLDIKRELELMGYSVELPPHEVANENGDTLPVQQYYALLKADDNQTSSWIWDKKESAMRVHLDKVTRSDAIVVLNYEKGGVAGYIGGNTFLEMGVAFYLKKKIYLLNPIPNLPYKDEIVGMKPIVLNGSIKNISRNRKRQAIES